MDDGSVLVSGDKLFAAGKGILIPYERQEGPSQLAQELYGFLSMMLFETREQIVAFECSVVGDSWNLIEQTILAAYWQEALSKINSTSGFRPFDIDGIAANDPETLATTVYESHNRSGWATYMNVEACSNIEAAGAVNEIVGAFHAAFDVIECTGDYEWSALVAKFPTLLGGGAGR